MFAPKGELHFLAFLFARLDALAICQQCDDQTAHKEAVSETVATSGWCVTTDERSK